MGTRQVRVWTRSASGAIFALLLLMPVTGCVAVGYRSGGGWFIWPGSFGLIVLLLLLWFVLRGRR